ncbi:MAG: hypothetical protein ACLQVG_19495 [Terriglobia bacterium]
MSLRRRRARAHLATFSACGWTRLYPSGDARPDRPSCRDRVTLQRGEMVGHPEGAFGFQPTDRALTPAADA